jgi:hypothetical protein
MVVLFNIWVSSQVWVWWCFGAGSCCVLVLRRCGGVVLGLSRRPFCVFYCVLVVVAFCLMCSASRASCLSFNWLTDVHFSTLSLSCVVLAQCSQLCGLVCARFSSK